MVVLWRGGCSWRVLVGLMSAMPPSSLAASQFAALKWLVKAERSLLLHAFGNAKPVRVDYIPYAMKIAVIFEFDHVVVCGACSSVTSGAGPRGKVIRVSFDRRTHQLAGASDGWAMRFCEVRGDRPPKSACLQAVILGWAGVRE